MTIKQKENNTGENLGLIALTAIIVSSMIGGGVDSLPASMATSSAVGPVVLSWLIAGFGVYFIASTFKILSDIRPDLQSGVYMYTREGFGPFAAFNVAWGYWLMTIFGNVAFAVMVMDALNYFFPGDFQGGNNFTSIVCASVLIWGFNFLVLSGVKVAGSINTIGTVAKIIPLVTFIFVLGYALNYATLTHDIWGEATKNSKTLGSVFEQTLAPMDVALWSFIGIEGAVALSGRAKNKSDVGKATLIGFSISLIICILVSILPFGVTTQSTLSQIPTPSTAGVMKMVVGDWGEWFMNIGVLVSVLTGWLAWTMLCAELPMVAAKNGTFPQVFIKTNKRGAASVSLWISSLIMQVVILFVYFSNNAWRTMLDIATVTVLPAYIGSTAYLLKICIKKEYNKYANNGIVFATISAVIGLVFCLFMLYAGGLQNVLSIPPVLALGFPLYVIAHREQKGNAPLFTKNELISFILLLIVSIVCLIALWHLFF